MEVTSTKDGQRVYFLSGLPDPGILKCWAASDVTNWWDFPADRPTAAFRPFFFVLGSLFFCCLIAFAFGSCIVFVSILFGWCVGTCMRVTLCASLSFVSLRAPTG